MWYGQIILHEHSVRMRRKKAERALTLEDRELRSLEAKQKDAPHACPALRGPAGHSLGDGRSAAKYHICFCIEQQS